MMFENSTKQAVAVVSPQQARQIIQQLSAKHPNTADGRRARLRISYLTEGDAEAQNLEPIDITIRDISEVGLGFLTRRQLETYQKLLITIEIDGLKYEFPCTVVHCTATVGMHKIGVIFDFAVKHLLNDQQ